MPVIGDIVDGHFVPGRLANRAAVAVHVGLVKCRPDWNPRSAAAWEHARLNAGFNGAGELADVRRIGIETDGREDSAARRRIDGVEPQPPAVAGDARIGLIESPLMRGQPVLEVEVTLVEQVHGVAARVRPLFLKCLCFWGLLRSLLR